MESKCKNCNNIVTGNKKRLFCSDKCRVYWNRSKKDRVIPLDPVIVQLTDEVQRLQLIVQDLRHKLECKNVSAIDNKVLDVIAKIKANRTAKIPAERDTVMGRISWKQDNEKEFWLLVGELIK